MDESRLLGPGPIGPFTSLFNINEPWLFDILVRIEGRGEEGTLIDGILCELLRRVRAGAS